MCKLCGEPHPLGQHTKFGVKPRAVERVKQIEARPLLTGPKGAAKIAARDTKAKKKKS